MIENSFNNKYKSTYIYYLYVDGFQSLCTCCVILFNNLLLQSQYQIDT